MNLHVSAGSLEMEMYRECMQYTKMLRIFKVYIIHFAIFNKQFSSPKFHFFNYYQKKNMNSRN